LLDRATTDLGVAPGGGKSGARAMEERIDVELLEAGITPGHESLYQWDAPSEERTGA
jgi:hypothetical protein